MRPTNAASVVAALVALAVGTTVAVAAPGGHAGRGEATKASDASAAVLSPVEAPALGHETSGAPAPTAGGSGASSDTACPRTSTTSSQPSDIAATHLFTRTTGDGVTIRAYQLPLGVDPGCGSDAATPDPPSSTPIPTGPVTPSTPGTLGCSARQVSVEMSDDAAVGVGTLGVSGDASMGSPASGAAAADTTVASPTAVTATATSGPLAITTGAFGVVEGGPVWWVAMAVPDTVARADVTFADGSTDTMVPVSGVVVLAHHVALATTATGSDPYDVQGSVQLLDASGDVVTTVTIPVQPQPVPGPLPAPAPATSVPSDATPPTPGLDPTEPAGTSPSDAPSACPLAPATDTKTALPEGVPGASASRDLGSV